MRPRRPVLVSRLRFALIEARVEDRPREALPINVARGKALVSSLTLRSVLPTCRGGSSDGLYPKVSRTRRGSLT